MKITYQNTWQDIFAAITLGESKGVANSRQVLWFLGCCMVLYWFIPPLFQDPTQPLHWFMALVAIALALYVWQGPAWYNKRFAKRYAANCPTGEAILEEKGITIIDQYGESVFLFSENIQVFDQEGLLAIMGAGKRFAAIPLHQQSEEVCQQWRSFFRENAQENYQQVTPQKKKR